MTKPVRVRFAPSPTGALHIGGVRTALYNYLLARKLGGTFILRIEDTDQKRYTPGAEQYIVEALQWLGLEPDESPQKPGEVGPYRQSQRKAMYRQFADQLIEAGYAYYAFDTEEELDAKRAEFEQAGKRFKYDASTRMDMSNSLTKDKATTQQHINAGTYVIRLMMPLENEEVVVKDIVKGKVYFKTEEMDDKVMLKADGMPTYHLANVVDDYHMKISHVIRGEEWLPSTPLHVLLYRYLGWAKDMPQFAHLPLILKPNPAEVLTKKTIGPLGERFISDFIKAQKLEADKDIKKVKNFVPQVLQDKNSLSQRLAIKDKDSNLIKELKAFLKKCLSGKLSKRDGDRLGIPVFPMDWNDPENPFKGFREWGFLPAAVINFLALLGWNPGTEQEMFSLDELVQAFSLERVSGNSGASFNFDKAKWFNQQYLINSSSEDLADLIAPIIEAQGQKADKAYLVGLAEMLKQRVHYLPEFWTSGKYFFEDIDLEKVKATQSKNLQKKVLKKWDAGRKTAFLSIKDQLEHLADFSAANINEVVEGAQESLGLGKGDIFPVFRLALSGLMGGPELPAMMQLLGKSVVIDRLVKFFDFCDAETETSVDG